MSPIYTSEKEEHGISSLIDLKNSSPIPPFLKRERKLAQLSKLCLFLSSSSSMQQLVVKLENVVNDDDSSMPGQNGNSAINFEIYPFKK